MGISEILRKPSQVALLEAQVAEIEKSDPTGTNRDKFEGKILKLMKIEEIKLNYNRVVIERQAKKFFKSDFLEGTAWPISSKGRDLLSKSTEFDNTLIEAELGVIISEREKIIKHGSTPNLSWQMDYLNKIQNLLEKSKIDPNAANSARGKTPKFSIRRSK